MSKEKGKTIGLFVDPEDYELYISLGLRQRKEALASAKQALLDALHKTDTKDSLRQKEKVASGSTSSVAASAPQPIEAAPSLSVQVISKETPEGQATIASEGISVNADSVSASIDASEGIIDAKGFLDGGW